MWPRSTIERTMDGVSRVDEHVADETPIDLQLVNGECREVAEPRLAAAEVVDADVDAQRIEAREYGAGACGVREQRRLGDLEHEPVGRDVGPGQRALDQVGESGLD